jgi:hypothetical protein
VIVSKYCGISYFCVCEISARLRVPVGCSMRLSSGTSSKERKLGYVVSEQLKSGGSGFNIVMVYCIVVAHFEMRAPDENRLRRRGRKRREEMYGMPKIQEPKPV